MKYLKLMASVLLVHACDGNQEPPTERPNGGLLSLDEMSNDELNAMQVICEIDRDVFPNMHVDYTQSWPVPGRVATGRSQNYVENIRKTLKNGVFGTAAFAVTGEVYFSILHVAANGNEEREKALRRYWLRNEYECLAPFDPENIESGQGVTRAMIKMRLDPIRVALNHCGELHAGPEKIFVGVDSDGSIRRPITLSPPDNTVSKCVETIFASVSFPRTKLGGGFAYPLGEEGRIVK